MSYRHDIFISYRRNDETRAWIKNHFLPLLKLRVGFELGKEPAIFLDEQLEAGVSWPIQLGKELGRSRILLALWAGDYFSSKWCTEEMSHMIARERVTKRRTLENPRGLVIPALIHDGEKFPEKLKHIQYFELQSCFNVRMARDSDRAEELDAILAREAPAIAKAIQSAPPWRSGWSKIAAKKFYKLLFQKEAPSQKSLPKFTGP